MKLIMVSPIFALSWLSFLVLIGVIISLLSQKTELPDILLLILAGVLLGQTKLVSFNNEFLTGLAIFALIMILFTSTTKFKLKHIGELSPISLRLAVVFLIFTIVFLTVFTHLLFAENIWDVKFLILSALFASMMSGTSPDVMLSIFKDKKAKIAEVLELESILNTPLAVLIPVIVMDSYRGSIVANVVVVKFLQGIMTGIGTGILLGVVVFNFMKKKYDVVLSPLAVIAVALVTYTLAENIGGNGVLAVSSLAIIFGMMELKEKAEIEKFSSIFTEFFKIVVFILIGMTITIPWDFWFMFKSLALFLIYIGIRYLSISVSLYNMNLLKKEKIFMSLNISKGLALATLIFLFSSYIGIIGGLNAIIDLALLFILYSIIISTLATKFSDYFIFERKDVLKKETAT